MQLDAGSATLGEVNLLKSLAIGALPSWADENTAPALPEQNGKPMFKGLPGPEPVRHGAYTSDAAAVLACFVCTAYPKAESSTASDFKAASLDLILIMLNLLSGAALK